MKRKLLSTVLAVTMAVSRLTGCGRSGTNEATGTGAATTDAKTETYHNLLHGTAKFILERIIALLTLAALAVFTLSGISLVQAGSLSVSPSLRIPMYYVYALLPLGYFLALIETIRQEVLAIKEFCTKRKEENA